jgi:hypothetical protein
MFSAGNDLSESGSARPLSFTKNTTNFAGMIWLAFGATLVVARDLDAKIEELLEGAAQ